VPPYEGRFLHRDFHPGNVLFDLPPTPADARITGVVDWAATSWGPVDLDVAHCCTNLALLHGPAWGLRFAEACEEAGGALAAAASERLYWRVRDGLAFSEDLWLVARPWREAGGGTDRADDASRGEAAGRLCLRRDGHAGLNQGAPARRPSVPG
jgi:aminoglycoside phosphotransferase (APT) family kinase protein